MEKLGNPNIIRIGLIMFFALLSVFVIVIGWNFSPNISYSGVTNSTTNFGERHQLEFNSIPTIINGITASTSIIVGFTGAIIGIFYQIFKDDNETKVLLLVSAFYELVPLIFLLGVYVFLLMGFTDGALKMALFAFILSLINIATVILGSFYRITRKKKKPTPPQPPATTNPPETSPPKPKTLSERESQLEMMKINL
jgi:hypothetical protein